MTDLRNIFAELGISQYLDDFIDQGFDSWQTILDITESDFDVLKVKLGHRRKLQRKIANSRGYSSDRALEPRNTPPTDRVADEQHHQKAKVESKDTGIVLGTKRKYRRHPKPDENAPERPPSAYVIFSNKMREELKGRNLSFTEIAKLVGEKWQNLSLTQKEQFEQQAFTAKEKYNNELNEYKKTSQFKEYSRYLADFKARHSRQNSAGETDNSKRPKLEGIQGNRNCSVSSATVCPTGESSSSNSLSDSASSVSTPTSTNCTWPRLRNNEDSPGRDMPKLATMTLKNTNGSNAKSPDLKSPTSNHFKIQDVALNSSPPRRLSGIDLQKDMTSYQQMREIEVKKRQSSPAPLLPHLQSLYQYPSQPHQMPLENQDTITLCSLSNSLPSDRISPTSSGLRILMEPPLDRSHQTTVYIDQKIDDRFERQLPPLLPPNISPTRVQSMLNQDQLSSKIFNNFLGVSSMQIPPIRNISDFNDRHVHKPMSTSRCEDLKIDHTSLLLKAGEFVNHNKTERIS